MNDMEVFDENNPIPMSYMDDLNDSRYGSYVGQSGNSIFDLCEGWVEDYRSWHKDCARVSKFYSGAIIESQSQRRTMGLIDHSNYSPGRPTLVRARDEQFNHFTQPRVLANITLKEFDGTPREKKFQEEKVSRLIDRYYRRGDNVFLDEMYDLCDRSTIHGDAVMMFPPEGEGFMPFQAQILTDGDAPQSVLNDNFRRWAVTGDLQITEVLDAVRAKRDGWSKGIKKSLEFFWKEERESIDPDYEDGLNPADMIEMCSQFTPEEEESYMQSNPEYCDFINSKLRVFFFYHKDFSDTSEGVPVDFYVVARFSQRSTSYGQDSPTPDPILFKKKGAYSSVSKCIVDFVLDSNVGVEDRTWKTIKGLGHMNFLPDSMTNLLISSLQNSAIDRNTPLWKVPEVSDQKHLEKFMKQGYKAHGVLPAGMDLVDKTKMGGSVGETLNLLSFFQGLNNEQSISQTNDSNGSKNELQVENIARRNQDQKRYNSRGVPFSMRVERLMSESYKRILGEIKKSNFLGKSKRDVSLLKKEMVKGGVDIKWFHPDNVEVTYPKLLGDGDPEARRLANADLIQNIALIPEDARQGVFMEWYAIRAGWDEAERVYKQENVETSNAEQTTKALSKFSAMLNIGEPFPVTPDDIPEMQIPVILNSAKKLVSQIIQTGEFSMREASGLIASGQYVTKLIMRLEELGRKEIAQMFSTELQNLSASIEEPMNNLLAKSQQGEESLDNQLKLREQDRKDTLAQNELLKTQLKNNRDQSIDERNLRKMDHQEYQSVKGNIRAQEINDIQRENAEINRLRAEVDLLKSNAKI